MKFLTIIIASIIAVTMAQNQEGGPQPDADAGVSFKMTKYYLFWYHCFRQGILVDMGTMDILFWVLVTTTPTMAKNTITTMDIMDMDMEDTDHRDMEDTHHMVMAMKN